MFGIFRELIEDSERSLLQFKGISCLMSYVTGSSFLPGRSDDDDDDDFIGL